MMIMPQQLIGSFKFTALGLTVTSLPIALSDDAVFSPAVVLIARL
jgi:hypothetical protein